jgi:hypothetical protein
LAILAAAAVWGCRAQDAQPASVNAASQATEVGASSRMTDLPPLAPMPPPAPVVLADSGPEPPADCDISDLQLGRKVLARAVRPVNRIDPRLADRIESGVEDDAVWGIRGLLHASVSLCSDCSDNFDVVVYRCRSYRPWTYCDELAPRLLPDLGWKEASPDRRIAIAQRFARRLLDAPADPESTTPSPYEPRPAGRPTSRTTRNGGVVLDYWVVTGVTTVAGFTRGPDRHRRVTFAPGGTCTEETVGQAAANVTVRPK